MSNVIDRFMYDGTIEGFLTVVKYCIDQKVMPRQIKPEAVVGRTAEYEQYKFIRSDYAVADKLYKFVGRRSSAEVQQMISDLFLTCIPNMEMDLFIMICKAIKYGAVIAEDYQDELMRRIQFSIRDMYREAASVLHGMNISRIDNVAFAVINPRNTVLPVIFKSILRDETYDDVLVYDKRHRMVLIRIDETDVILDLTRVRNAEFGSIDELYKNLWPYFRSEHGAVTRQVHKEKADELSKLWYIAV